MVNGVFQVQDAIFDGVADVILRVRSGGGHLLIGTAFCELLMLQQMKGGTITNSAHKAPIRVFLQKRSS